MRVIKELDSCTIAEMQLFARKLAKKLRPSDTITLSGDLGSGKTTFARALISEIAVDSPQISSPTFNIMQSYDVRLADDSMETLWHLDLYRLEEEDEAINLGLEELWNHIVIIEWADIIKNFLPEHLNIVFYFGNDASTRNLKIYGNNQWIDKIS